MVLVGDFGKRRRAAVPLLAERYRSGIDVSHYWVSEKLDGVRAHWDGRVLRFRSGNLVSAPRGFSMRSPPNH